MRFGRLVALDYADSNRAGARWRCRCDCGREKVVGSLYLLRGTTLSCGCYGHERYVASGRMRRKGAVITYRGVHEGLRRERGPARDYPCTDCRSPADEWSLCADPVERHIGITDRGYPVTYSTRLTDYEPRCRRCHRLHDLRAKGIAAS